MSVLMWPHPLPPVFSRLEDQADKGENLSEPAQRQWPVAVEGRGAGEQLCPLGGLPLHRTQERLPSHAPGLSHGAQLLGAAGMAQSLQDTAEPCPAHVQKVINAQWVGFKEAHEHVPGGPLGKSIFTETLDILSFGSPLTGIGVLSQLCSHTLPVLHCLLLSGAQGRGEALLGRGWCSPETLAAHGIAINTT